MTSHEVAVEIQRQLGRKALFMMGAKNLISTEHRSLIFSIGRNAKSVNTIEIVLDPSDTYTVKFTRRRWSKGELKITTIAEVSDVFCDSLHSVIEENTGLYLSL